MFGNLRQSLPEAIGTSNALQRSNAEPTSNQPNIRPPSIQLQRRGPVSAKMATSSPSTSKWASSTQSGQINSGNGSAIRRSNTSRLASNSAIITPSQAPSLPSSAIGYKPGYVFPTQVFKPYHQDQKRRRNEATPAAKGQDARAQPLSNALHSDIQAQQAEETGSNIAGEMKALLDKMDELRQKDPAMFQKLLIQKLWDGSGNISDGSATSVVQSSFSESSGQSVQAPTPQKAVATSAHPAADAPSQLPQSEGLEQASYLITDLRVGGRKNVVENGEEELLGLGHVSAMEPKLKGSTAGQSPANLTASGALSSQSASTGSGYRSLQPPSSASTDAPAIGSAIAASDDDEFAKNMRTAVARTVVEVLKSVPENNARDITADEIYSMLEHNPPYVQLCDILEKRGLKFHPPISSQAVVASSPVGPLTSAHAESPKQVNRSGKKVPSVPGQHGPGPKEMLSRKRNFSEIVDLTQLSDNDDYVLSNKRVQIESTRRESTPLEMHQQVGNMQQHRPLESRSQGLKASTHPTDNIAPRSRQQQENKTILAKPIKKIDAVRKRYYNPKTVARDILIATGRHPHERPLNAHMAPLLDRYINIDSDLSTFDWNAIDPGVELHNLVTLRKHIAKLHRPSPDEIDERGFSCWWKNCRYLQPDDEGSVVTMHTFGTAEAWLDHINEDHLRRVAMKWGDGPNSSPIDSQTLLQEKTRYLSDEHGAGVTPSVSKQRNAYLPADTMVFTKPVGDKTEAAAQKAFMKVHRPSEKLGPKSTAEEILRAMEARKGKIGPGIERGGSHIA
ncbi:hypothetical protein DV737_g2101, partial [Chaetothyriales sp. CBS 132003]